MPTKKKSVDSEMATTGEWLESPFLARVANRVALQHGLPEDELPELLQDLRVAVWELGVGIRVSAAWIFGVATHKAVDLLRRRARARRHEQDLAAFTSRRERDLELHHLLHTRVAGFPMRLRQFYDLHYTQGFSEREVALSLGVCRATVRWLNRRCLHLLGGRDRYAGSSMTLAGGSPASLERKGPAISPWRPSPRPRSSPEPAAFPPVSPAARLRR
jgi:DNA-directed RNA polymerase specialized sigma24 family protein